MKPYQTPATDAIVADIRQQIDTHGKVVDEQAFAAWVPAHNLLRVILVCDQCDWRAIARAMPVNGANLAPRTTSSYTVVYEFEIVIDLYLARRGIEVPAAS